MKFFVVIVYIFTLLIPFSLSYAENKADIEKLFEEGLLALQSSNYEEALSYFDQVLEIEPSHTSTLINKGNALKNLDRNEEALSTIDKALEIEPSNIVALINKGGILIKLDRNEEALSTIDKALEIEPSNTMVLNNKGVLLANLNQHWEAIATFDQVLEMDPNNTTALRNRNIAFDKVMIVSTNDSKYLAHSVVEVRNSQGVLVGVLVTNDIKYLPHHLTDEYLQLFPVTETIVIDNQVYEKRVIIVNGTFNKEFFISNTNILTPKITSQLVAVFRALHHGIPVTPGDTATTEFTIFRLIE